MYYCSHILNNHNVLEPWRSLSRSFNRGFSMLWSPINRVTVLGDQKGKKTHYFQTIKVARTYFRSKCMSKKYQEGAKIHNKHFHLRFCMVKCFKFNVRRLISALILFYNSWRLFTWSRSRPSLSAGQLKGWSWNPRLKKIQIENKLQAFQVR